VVWVRSNPFSSPKTGRLAVWVWLKIPDPGTQPPLRLAVEGRLNGETYYRPAEVGAKVGRATPPPLTNTWAPYLLRIDNLPTEVTDLRVAFDLMGQGEVWVDDVQVFDLWFDTTERNELLKRWAVANLKLGEGAVSQCDHILNGYWPEFLRRHVVVEEPRFAATTTPTGTGAPVTPEPDTEQGEPDEQPTSTSWLDRLKPKSMLPKWLR
jgi:hypothetical protein